MALYLINTTPGDISDPLLPGTPVVFSLKSDALHVNPASINARIAFSNITQKVVSGVAVLPEFDSDLVKRVAVTVATPEHRLPLHSILPRTVSAGDLVIGPGTSNGIDEGIYEVKLPIGTYDSVLASVSFRISSVWSKAARYWSHATTPAPVYLGLEYGVRNTGLFVFLRDDGVGGSLVAGGPLLAYGALRGSEVELSGIGWTSLSDGDVFKIFFYIDSASQTAQIWTQLPSDEAPVPQSTTFPLSQLGEFPPSTASFSQHRDGPSLYTTLYFGNGGGDTDILNVVDWAIYPYAPPGIVSGEGMPGFNYYRRPDLPFTFFSTDKTLPTDQKLGRWERKGIAPLSPSFWFQPGKKTTPLYTVLQKEVFGDAYISRKEPQLTNRQEGFSVEAWIAGSIDSLSSVDTGIGIRVNDGQYIYQLVALDTEIHRSIGVLKDPSFPGDLVNGYYTVLDSSGNLQWVDYRTLKLVRLTLDRRRSQLLVFVEDMDTPFLIVPTTDTFPTPTVSEGVIDVGILDTIQSAGSVNLASLSYLTRYDSWETADGLPSNAPIPFSFVEVGGGNAYLDDNGRTHIEKTSFGSLDNGSATYFQISDSEFAYEHGFQIDFRVRMGLYSDINGLSNAPNVWTGVGLTVFLGNMESPLDQYLKLHLGFFDCGAYGRKIGITPGSASQEGEILNQTELGRLHSADAGWMTLTSYRLVYRPRYKVEVYGPNLIKDVPLISIPWDQFVPQVDSSNTLSGMAFGNFNSANYGLSIWEYVRWGVSTGFEVEVTQEPHGDNYFTNAFGGRLLTLVEAEEVGG